MVSGCRVARVQPGPIVSLEDVSHSRHQVVLRFAVDGLSFTTSLWYREVDLDALAREYGPEALRRILFHIAVFELNKVCSLRPESVELGPFADLWTPALEALWREVFVKIWAQWRYENDDPTYEGPRFCGGEATGAEPLRVRRAPAAETLAFCGGGKDSLASMRLLERAGVDYDVLVYASSIYGPAAPQHRLIDALVQRCRPKEALRQWVYDDFLDSPVLDLHPELGVKPKTLTAAETPSSVFAALPYVLSRGYTSFSLGHERSADQGQLVWARTGEDVNHQWGKSAAAERLLSAYIREHLVADFTYFSPLKPIHDLVIFSMLRQSQADVPFTHSCNLRKPWCLECPKCLYVWLGMAAFLPRTCIRATFGADDLLAREALVPGFRALLGLDGRQPFECIGGAEEVRVLLGLCERHGYRGPTIDLFCAEVGRSAALRLAEGYLDVDLTNTAIPASMRARVGPELASAAASARVFIRDTLTLGESPRAGLDEGSGSRGGRPRAGALNPGILQIIGPGE